MKERARVFVVSGSWGVPLAATAVGEPGSEFEGDTRQFLEKAWNPLIAKEL
jgi:hypothetical protein